MSLSASTPTSDAETVARFCAQVAQIERVYCKRARSQEEGIAIPLALFRLIMNTKRSITLGQIEVVTKVYQDLFRRASDSTGYKVYCMGRIKDHKFPRGLTPNIINRIPLDPLDAEWYDKRNIL